MNWKEVEIEKIDKKSISPNILIKSWENIFITFEETEKLLKDNVYYEIVFNEYGDKMYIFDLKKNSIKPILDKLENYTIWWKWSFWTIEIIIFWIIIIIWVWFIFFKQEKNDNIKTNTWSIILPINTNINAWNTEIQNLSNQKEIKLQNNNFQSWSLAFENEIKSNNDFTKDLHFQKLNYEYDSCILYNEKIQKDLDFEKQEKEKIRQELKFEIDKNISLTSQYWWNNKLYYYLWEKVFNLCEKTSSELCKTEIYNFYKLNQK